MSESVCEHNRLRIPPGRRQTNWLSIRVAEELSQGLLKTNPADSERWT